MFKKLVSLILTGLMAAALLLCAVCTVSFAETSSAEDSLTIRIAGLKGPTSIGMVKLMQDNEDLSSAEKYEFTLAGSADELTPKLIRGELDIAALPANLASVLYNNTEGNVQLLAINTLGVIYIVDRSGEINTVSDLKGRTIYASGKGSTPEYAFSYILTENGIDPDKDLTIEWKSEHSEVVQALANDPSAAGLLPQPFVTVAMTKVEGLDIALDLTEEWDKLDNGSSMITGVLAVNKDFADEHPEAVLAFLEEYAASVEYVNTHVDEAAVLCEKYDIITEEVAQAAIPYCNIVCITADDISEPISGYLNVLWEANPASVGGEVPGEDFIWSAK